MKKLALLLGALSLVSSVAYAKEVVPAVEKLALLLGALSLVSSVAYAKEVVPAVEEVVVVEEVKAVEAAPALTVTYFGQGLEFDNTSGNAADIAEGMHFSNSVGLAYGDWTFDLMARKTWSVDTDDHIHSTGEHRIDLDAWRDFGNYSLGFRWRQQEAMDRYYLRAKYNYGMFSGNMDVAYTAVDEKDAEDNDGWYFEGTPVAVTVGPVTAGYYVKSEKEVRVGDNDGLDYWFRHQLRLSMPIYQGEKLNLGVQYGWEFANNIEYTDNYTGAYKHDTNSHILWLNASYKVTENLTVSGYYEYDMFKWDLDGKDTGAGSIAGSQQNKESNKYYGEFFVGWTYTF